MCNLKPMSPWMGGKRKEMKMYLNYIPDDIDVYIEPFVDNTLLGRRAHPPAAPPVF